MKVAILGAECTGKTALARALAAMLQAEQPAVVWIPEYLREWCDAHGRTPLVSEQAHVAQLQMARVNAHPAASLVLSDTAPLMTAVYSDVIFGDTSLYAPALEQHRAFDLTLVLGLDLAWVGDGIQRDGVAMRARVNQRLREVLTQHGIAFSAVYGTGEARSLSAMQALVYSLGTTRPGGRRTNWKWNCEKCSDPECEHRLFSGLVAT